MMPLLPLQTGGKPGRIKSPARTALPYPEPDTNYSSRRLNHLARELGARSYLEIGVFGGDTFQKVEVDKKTGIDPEFQFNWKDINNDNSVILREISSDCYFESLDPGQCFDLVFIDGLHTYDQTYRDLQNTLRHSNPRSVVLIDDTIPCDVFSTCRDQQECIRLRTIAGGLPTDNRWHGDTYKLIPLLALFNSDMNFCTISDRGNPQTLVWRKNTTHWADPHAQMQAFWATENLSCCDYLWLLNNLSLYALTTEDEALARVVTDLSAHQPRTS